MKEDRKIAPDLQILECTLRDGSYAVDFRFTAQDTAVLCQLLSHLGFKFIEIGHGFGIGASEFGKGEMPSSDKKLLSIAKSSVKNSKIGMFCIPNIATLQGLEEMADLGLDFVRIGSNAISIEETYPYIEDALKRDLYTFVNFMKAYAISPDEFAKKAKVIDELGAHAVYIVDSAGCMYPEDVKAYIARTKELTDIKIGFHGHNNLHLAVANTLEVIENGGNFVDTTIYGIGRGAGNAPTEVILAILKDTGINVGVDMLELMEIGEKYLGPLKNQLQMHSMLSVVTGYGKFHSSFLPRVKKVADEYNVDLYKLIIAMGRKDPSSIDDRELIETAKNLTPRSSLETKYDIVSFFSPKIGKDYLSNTLKSVKDLIDGLITVSAKGRSKIVIEVTAANNPDENFVLSEYVTSDQDMTMGRIYFGSIGLLQQILELIGNHVSLLLIDNDAGRNWVKIDDVYLLAQKYISKDYILRYSSNLLQGSYILENLLLCKARHNLGDILICGNREQIKWLLSPIVNLFNYVFIYETDSGNTAEEQSKFYEMFSNCIILRSPIDWKHLNINIKIVLCLASYLRDINTVVRGINKNSYFIITNFTVKTQIDELPDVKGIRTIYLDPSFAYKGQFSRWMVNLRMGTEDVRTDS